MQLISILVDLEDGVEDIIHVGNGSQERAGGPEHNQFLTHLIAVWARGVQTILLESLRGKELLVDL